MKVEMRIEVPADLMKYGADSVTRNVEKELRRAIIDAERIAKEVVPKRTAALANSIHHGGGGLSWWALTQLEYSDYIEEGTGAHTITGNPFLMSDGSNPNPLEHPVHSVFHPGNAAYKYMETALYMATEDLEARILEAILL